MSAPFLDISDAVQPSGVEQGLLSVAFPPQYSNKNYFYVNYTGKSGDFGDTVIARYRVTGDPDIADPDSEQIVLTIGQQFDVHNGGHMAFGPNDGDLYIAMGDGGLSAQNPNNFARDPSSLLGKMLRIDVEAGVDPYSIPPSNLYTQTNGYRGEIWALGLRNPWGFGFDRQTGDLFVADVGQERT